MKAGGKVFRSRTLSGSGVLLGGILLFHSSSFLILRMCCCFSFMFSSRVISCFSRFQRSSHPYHIAMQNVAAVRHSTLCLGARQRRAALPPQRFSWTGRPAAPEGLNLKGVSSNRPPLRKGSTSALQLLICWRSWWFMGSHWKCGKLTTPRQRCCFESGDPRQSPAEEQKLRQQPQPKASSTRRFSFDFA